MTTTDETMMVVYKHNARDYRNLADAYEAHGLLAEARRCRDLADKASLKVVEHAAKFWEDRR